MTTSVYDGDENRVEEAVRLFYEAVQDGTQLRAVQELIFMSYDPFVVHALDAKAIARKINAKQPPIQAVAGMLCQRTEQLIERRAAELDDFVTALELLKITTYSTALWNTVHRQCYNLAGDSDTWQQNLDEVVRIKQAEYPITPPT